MKPTDELRGLESDSGIPLAASSLRMKLVGSGSKSMKKSHFIAEKLTDVITQEDTLTEVIKATEEFLRDLGDDLKERCDLATVISECDASIVRMMARLRKGISNEMELWYTVADPILDQLSRVLNLKVCQYLRLITHLFAIARWLLSLLCLNRPVARKVKYPSCSSMYSRSDVTLI